MADIRGEIFACARDILRQWGDPERVAIHKARDITDRTTDLLSRESFLARPSFSSAHYSSKALEWETSRRVEQILKPLIKYWRQDLEASPFYTDILEGDFEEFVDSLGARVMDLWVAMMGLIERAAPVLKEREGAMAALLISLASAPSLFPLPPLLLPKEDGVRLYYLGPVLDVIMWVTLWDKKAQEQEDYLEELKDEYFLLERVAGVQWRAAGIVGNLIGRDDIQYAWYPFVLSHRTRRGDCLGEFLDNPAPGKLRPLFELEEKVEPTFELDIVAQVTRHILYGEPLKVPPLNCFDLRANDRVVATRATLLHPLVSFEEVAEWQRDARRRMGGPSRRSLRPEEKAFLEMIEEVGGNPGQRLPRGFWPRFLERWQERYPDKPANVNQLRVKYHRLCRRLRESS